MMNLEQRAAIAYRYGYNIGASESSKYVADATEGRIAPGYGWCGDSATDGLYYAGSRSPALNRIAVNKRWRPAENITMLCEAAGTKYWSAPWTKIRLADFIVQPRKDGDHIGLFLCSSNRAFALTKTYSRLLERWDSNGAVRDEVLFLIDKLQRGDVDDAFAFGDAVVDSAGRQIDYFTLDGNGWGERLVVTLRRSSQRGGPSGIVPGDTRLLSLVESTRLFGVQSERQPSSPPLSGQDRNFPRRPPTSGRHEIPIAVVKSTHAASILVPGCCSKGNK
jgi:hypothetical protein